MQSLTLEVTERVKKTFNVEFPLYFRHAYDEDKDDENDLDVTHLAYTLIGDTLRLVEITFERYYKTASFERYEISVSLSNVDKLTAYESTRLAKLLSDEKAKSDDETFYQELRDAWEWLEAVNEL